MALPEDVLSDVPVPSQFVGARALPVTNLVDFEHGGIAIQDTSRGLVYQVWRARVIDTSIMLGAPNTEEFPLYEGLAPITEVSLAFDQNMRPSVAFVEGGVSKLLWYDTLSAQQVITTFESGIITPRVTLDDKRPGQLDISDIILAYKKGDQLLYRRQRDRFQEEHDPTELMPEPERTAERARIAQSTGVIKIGMNRGLRLQFMLAY